MRISENRWLALAVCIVCAMVSIFGFGGMKLKSRYDEVTEYFIEGDDGRHSMENYLDRCSACASDLAYEARQYLDDDTQIENVLALAEKLSKDKGPGGDRDETFSELTDAVEELYSALQSAGHGGEAAVTVAYGDYQSACDLIARDGYYEIAKAYNKTACGFPATKIARLWGIEWADPFGR